MAQADPQNILVIHFGQLGDVVLGLPALKAIRGHFAAARITVLSGRSTEALIKLSGFADDQIGVDRVALRDGNKARSVADMLRLVKELRGRKFDLVIDLHSLYETNLLGYLSGAGQRLYANRDRRSIDRLSNFPIKPPDEDRSEHHAVRYLRVLEPLGIRGAEKNVRLEPPAHAIAEADRMLSDAGVAGRAIVGLFIGAGHESRRWPAEKFADTAQELSALGISAVVLLGPEEREMRPYLSDLFRGTARLLDEVSLDVFLALLTRLDVVVSGDTGPMHLAAVAGASVVLLLPAGSPDIFRPLTNHIVVLNETSLVDIKPQSVTQAVLSLLDQH